MTTCDASPADAGRSAKLAASGEPSLLTALRGLIEDAVTAGQPESAQPQDQLESLTGLAVLLEHASRVIEAAHTRVLAQIAATAEAAAPDPKSVKTWLISAANHIAAATGSGDGAITRRIGQAREICEEFPALVPRVSRGELSVGHASDIARIGAPVPQDAREEYLEKSLEIAKTSTPARLRRHLPKLVESLAPEAVRAVQRRALAERRVWVSDRGDGTALLGAILPAPLAAAAHDRLVRMAKRVLAPEREDRAPGEAAPSPAARQSTATHSGAAPITLRQLQADLLLELLLASQPNRQLDRAGTTPGPVSAKIHVTVPVETLLAPAATEQPRPGTQVTTAQTDRSGRLAGFGLIDPAIARGLAADATSWERIFIDASGGVVATDNYEPTAAVRRAVLARDQHCRFPGCLEPPGRCEFDHSQDWASGGKTDAQNLSLKCKRHHALKHPDVQRIARWRVTQRPDGRVEWHSPFGGTFTDLPDPL